MTDESRYNLRFMEIDDIEKVALIKNKAYYYLQLDHVANQTVSVKIPVSEENATITEDTFKPTPSQMERTRKLMKFRETWLLEFDGKIIGTGALTYYDTTVWLGGMAIDPNFQRQGHASYLLTKMIEHANNKNYPTIELYASEMGYPLYKKFGFKPEYKTRLLKIDHFDEPDESLDLSITVSRKLEPWMLTFDRKTMACNREAVLRHFIEDGHQVIGLPGKGFLLFKNEGIGCLEAINDIIARNLLYEAFIMGARQIIVVDPLSEVSNSSDHSFYKDLELSKGDSMITTKMTLGPQLENFDNKAINNLYAILNFSFG